MEKVIEVMRIKRYPPMGKLVVEVGSEKFERFSQLPNDVVKQLVMAAIGELIIFVDGYQTLVDAGVAPPLVDQSFDGEPKTDASMSEREAAFRAAVEEERLSALAGDVPPPVVPPPPVKEVKKTETGPLEEELDIAGQVNIFLQQHVQQTAELRGRSIYIAGDPTGGLTINVDGQRFETPSDIDDPAVRSAIQQALRDWESGQQAPL